MSTIKIYPKYESINDVCQRNLVQEMFLSFLEESKSLPADLSNNLPLCNIPNLFSTQQPELPWKNTNYIISLSCQRTPKFFTHVTGMVRYTFHILTFNSHNVCDRKRGSKRDTVWHNMTSNLRTLRSQINRIWQNYPWLFHKIYVFFFFNWGKSTLCLWQKYLIFCV